MEDKEASSVLPRRYLREILKMYREQPCLWDTNHKYYKNREKRDVAYNLLLDKYREYCPAATIDTLKKRLNNCRTAYRRELKRAIISSQAGDEDSLRMPTLWYFSLLSFLHEHELAEAGTDERENEEVRLSLGGREAEEIEVEDDEDDEFDNLKMEQDYSPEQTEEEEAVLVDQMGSSPALSPSPPSPPSPPMPRRKKKKMRHAQERVRDRFDASGESIAFKLRGLSKTQRILAEKLISDVLYEAELENLNRHCRLVTAETIDN